ncbi:MAG: hypothetical protein ACJ71R_10560 [Nitrososphaeraceae archaeon]
MNITAGESALFFWWYSIIISSKVQEAKDGKGRRALPETKTRMYCHESSWSQHGLNTYDGQGCNQFTGCIPECGYNKNYLHPELYDNNTTTEDDAI